MVFGCKFTKKIIIPVHTISKILNQSFSALIKLHKQSNQKQFKIPNQPLPSNSLSKAFLPTYKPPLINDPSQLNHLLFEHQL